MDHCSLREQGVLVTGMRGCDGLLRDDLKPWTCFIRREVLVNADSTGKAKFMGHGDLPPIYAIHEGRSLDELPVHFYAHFMHALQVIGIRHPRKRVALTARHAYRALVEILHLREEADEDMIERLRTR